MAQESLILVDENDISIGTEEKLSAHERGLLHRAFSIFVFNSKGETLLQQRALTKYHSAGLWSNTCCGHPRPDETVIEAAQRRLKEEMGFVCELRDVGMFHYRTKLENNLLENELDHICVGQYDREVKPNSEEAMDFSWRIMDDVARDILNRPELYSVWFKIIISEHRDLLQFH